MFSILSFTRLASFNTEVVDPLKVFDYSKTQSDYSDMLSSPRQEWYYKKNNQVYAKVIPMTFDEYLENCAKAHRNSSITQEKRAIVSKNVDGIAEAMLNGKKFMAPNIDFKHHDQEGRHRCAAIAKLNGKDYKIPVICFFDWTPEIQHQELDLPKGWYIEKSWLRMPDGDSYDLITDSTEDEFRSTLKRIKKLIKV